MKQLIINIGHTAPDQELIKLQIIESLNLDDLTPLQRYAMANALSKAAAEATSEIAVPAIQFALDKENGCQPEAGNGKDFYKDGQCFRITFKNDYNYNQGDENGRLWATKVKEQDELKKKSKSLTQYISGLQKLILEEHPRLQPTETKVSISYFCDK